MQIFGTLFFAFFQLLLSRTRVTNNYLLQCYSSIVNPTPLNTPNNSNKCPTRLSSGGGGSSMGAQYSAMLSTDDAVATGECALNSLVDNGDTQAMLTGLSTTSAAGAAYTDLVQAAPYLSDTVLTVAMLGAGLTPVQKKNVITACSPLPLGIRHLIDNTNVPDGVKAQLWALQNGTNAREEKEEEIRALHVKRGEILKNLIEHTFNSQVPGTVDTLCTILQNEKGVNEKLILIQLFVNMKRMNEAENIINSLRNDYDESTSEFNNEVNQTLDVYEIMIQYAINNYNIDSLRELIQINKKLFTKIESEPSNFANAFVCNLLCIAGLKNDKEFILLPEPINENEKRFDMPSPARSSQINIYPVPAKNELFIESNAEIEGNIVIYDNLNKPLKQISSNLSKSVRIDISGLANGIYYLRIDNDFYKFIKTE